MTTVEAGSFDAVIFDAGGVFVLPDPTVIPAAYSIWWLD